MTRALLASVLALCAGVLLVRPAPTAAQPLPAPPKAADPDGELVGRVKDAIDKGVKYLKDYAAKNNGNWEGLVLKALVDMDGGPTALAVLALLNSGVKVDDPAVQGGLKYLRTRTPTKTYVVALQTMALSEALVLARDKKDLPLIQKNVAWFETNALRRGGKLAGWSYPGNDIADNSNTQYALLGLYAAKLAGAKVEEQTWEAIQDYYTRTQQPEGDKAGYWLYHNAGGEKASFTMSVGGACGLLIAGMGLDKSRQQLNDATGVAARCGFYADNDALAKGMHWIGGNFNFEQGKSYFYNFYGIERLGRLSGQRFIGKVDWYREGCERLVKLQQPDGSFAYTAGAPGLDKSWPVVMSSFALLYLSKGRTPVLISKFAWGNTVPRDPADKGPALLVERDPEGNAMTGAPNWNRKHNDCRNLVEFAQRDIFDGAPLSWQVYDMRLQDLGTPAKIDSEVGLLLASPIVYLNGHGPMPFVSRATEKLAVPEQILQRYVEEGGFLLGEACCGDKAFAASFGELMARLFPGSGLKKVPPEHAIWTMFPGVSPADFPDLMYLDRGCRTVAVFSPSPLAGYWEERRFIPADGRDPKNRGEKAFCLARNVIAYATGMELPKPKLSRTAIVTADAGGIARSKFRAVQLKYISSAEVQTPPASDALRNLMAYLGQHAKLDVALNSEVLTPADPKLTRYKFMYLHGRKPVAFTPDESDNVKANLQTGGLLLADAACNDIKQWKAFDQSFRDAMVKLFPDQKLVPIPLRTADGKDEPLFKIAAQAGINLREVKCRREKPDGTGPEKELRTYPVDLEGIQIKGRWVVVYSKYDIGCAIEGHKSADCLGHDKESALRIASAVVLYALRR